MICPAGTVRIIMTTATFEPADTYKDAPTAPSPTISATSSATIPVRRCRVGNAAPAGPVATRPDPFRPDFRSW